MCATPPDPVVEAPPHSTRVPATPPPFDFATLKRAIPKHCFERSTLRSLSYLAFDVLVCSALWYAALWIDHPAVPSVLRYVLWPAYWYLQGAFATGIWVIAHECGHGAFSDHAWVNDGVGFVFHSALLVPYFSWKHSHRRHHKNTGSVDLDEVFVPPVVPAGSEPPWYWSWFVYRVGFIVFMSLLGWPLYLLFNVSGHYYPRWANHFDPTSPIFVNKRERIEVLASDAGLLAVLGVLSLVAKAYGYAFLLKMYVAPYLIVNFWLVMITFLQHTHPDLPHYGEKEWDWLRGALATVDRSYGWLDVVHHHIADTHVAHHLFSYMPHYHAQEATEAIKKVVGPYYRRDERNVFVALWQDAGACSNVAPDRPGEQTYWFVQKQPKQQAKQQQAKEGKKQQ